MTTNLDRARLIAKDVELLSVSLADARLTSSIDPLDVPELLQLSSKYRARYEVRAEDTRHLRVFVEHEFGAAGDGGEDKRKPVLSLKATFLLVYRLPPNASYPEDSYEHFAWLNGPYNAWPYWRELVQTVSGRVGLAGVVIPVYRPQIMNVPEQLTSVREQSRSPYKSRAVAKRK